MPPVNEKKTRSRLLLGLGIAAAVTLVVWFFRPEPIAVDVQAVRRGALRVTVDEEGRTRVRDRFVVAAPIAGRLERLAWHAGDSIELGAVVARMHPQPLDPRGRAEAQARLEASESAHSAAESRIEQSRTALTQAQRWRTRAKSLGASGTIAKEELENAELAETARRMEVEAALFSAKAAAFDVEAARAALMGRGTDGNTQFARCSTSPEQCLELRAPVSGRLLRILEESERVVASGAPLVEIGDPHALEIVVDVLSRDAVRVRPGATMWIESWGGTQPLEAKVRVVEPAGFTKVSTLGVEEQRVNIIGEFVAPPETLGDGYRVEARIVVWESGDAVTVPASAIFRRGDEWFVFVDNSGTAKLRKVELGQRGDARVEITSGLGIDEKVVVHPSDQVEDGVRIRPL